MAVSDYDILAFDTKGKASTGIVKNSKGNSVELYKNWVYIHSPEMWRDSYGYIEHIIAHMNEGDINIAGFEIKAKRVCIENQYGTFVFVKYDGNWDDEKKKSAPNKFFAGIACYGYKNKIKEVLKSIGRENENSENWCNTSTTMDGNTIHALENFDTGEKIVYWDENKDGGYDYSKDWIGVSKEMHESFMKWIDEIAEDYTYDNAFKNWFKKVKNAKAIRYNQGDAYFATHLGTDINASEVGKANAPIISKMIAGMGKK